MSSVKTKPACGICGKAVVEKFKPFCSARCAQIDLGRWLGETYRVPIDDEDSELSAESHEA